jgi:hypothetical protein
MHSPAILHSGKDLPRHAVLCLKDRPPTLHGLQAATGVPAGLNVLLANVQFVDPLSRPLQVTRMHTRRVNSAYHLQVGLPDSHPSK